MVSQEITRPEGEKTVCVTGASGFIGSWLTMRLLEKGYSVRATVRDPDDEKKVKHLAELPNAKTHLTLWKADLSVLGSFDDAIDGCDGVFHVATPMDFESSDPENEVIKPTVEGILDIMRASAKAKTVKRVVFTSSAGTVDVEEHHKPVYDENDWSDLDFVRRVKMTGWMYFVSKSLAEKEAWKYAKENNIDFISIIPTLVLGPFITPSMPPSLITTLSLFTGNAHIFLFEHPDAKGRYICNIDDINIYELAEFLTHKYPEYNIPTFEGIEEREKLKKVKFSSEKLKKLGFEYKYGLEDMYKGALESCKEKGLLPVLTEAVHVDNDEGVHVDDENDDVAA
ncbi:Bifunctional dihydroflavonol 4-reductase/flavanone 4-reductase [Linum perenne]